MAYGCLCLSTNNDFAIEFSNNIEAFKKYILRTTENSILVTKCNPKSQTLVGSM